MPKFGKRLYCAAQVLLLSGAIAAAVLSSRSEDWHPAALVVLIAVLIAIGQRLTVTIRNQQLTAGFIGCVLAMTLLGPAPAVALGLAILGGDAVRRRLTPIRLLGNLTAFATFLVAGGLITRALVGSVHAPHSQVIDGTAFALLVFGVFMVTNAINFGLIALDLRVYEGRSVASLTRYMFIPLLPGQIATGALAAVLAVAYIKLGFSALLAAVLVLLIFQYLAVALLRSEDRADQLEARSMHLASLQLGVLTTLVETLALRDRGAARHAAAVARYARDLAAEVGCSEKEQDLLHTAGLLHDIGKFAFPDRILRGEILSDEDWAAVRRHPQDGATLVGRLDGYGPVAEAILYHHEQVDGNGYPAGLIGNEIPLHSRILAICSAFDTMTSRDGYRSPMTPQDAMTELRKGAGRNFDPELVQSFIAMLQRDGPVTHAAGEHADFESELAFERRARAIAQPPR
jgi:putative nucleotidyltransferase with HDIG domain